MASSRTFLLVVAVAFAVAVAVAVEIPIGGGGADEGWRYGFDYQEWAKTQKFNVNDTLVFDYSKGEHNVIKVNKPQFDSCQALASDKLLTLTSGFDKVPLGTEAGTQYFICGIEGHCSEGKMKIAVDVKKP